MIQSELLSMRIPLVKVALKIVKEKYLISVVLKINPAAYKTNDLNREKIIGSLYEKIIVIEYTTNELLSRTKQSY